METVLDDWMRTTTDWEARPSQRASQAGRYLVVGKRDGKTVYIARDLREDVAHFLVAAHEAFWKQDLDILLKAV